MTEVSIRVLQRRTLLLLITLMLTIVAGSGCKKKEEAKPQEKAQSQVQSEASSESVLRRVPADAYGFFHWQGAHPAYAKLQDSPWGEGAGVLDSIKDEELSNVLKAIDIKLEDKKVWRTIFSDAVAFIAPGVKKDSSATSVNPSGAPANQQASSPSIGILFRADKSVSVRKKMVAGFAELKKAGKPVAQLTHAGIKGFSFASTQAAPGLETLYVFENNNLALVTNSKETVDTVYNGKNGTQPALFKEARYKEAFKGLVSGEGRFGYGYVDLTRLRDGSASLGVPAEKTTGLEAFAFSTAMLEAPHTDVRLLVDKKSEVGVALAALSQSGFEKVASALPRSPLMTLSLDGTSLRVLRDRMAKGATKNNPAAAQYLALLDHAKRVSLALRMPEGGASLLPIPELSLVLQTTQPAETQAQMERLVLAGLESSPTTAGMSWSDQAMPNGSSMKTIMSPMGIGAFLGSNGDMVLLSSSGAHAKEVLGDGTGKTFAAGLSGEKSKGFVREPAVGQLYFDFKQFADAMGGMGAYLNMFAAQNKQDLGKMLNAENLEHYKKMGTMFASFRVSEGRLDISSFYAKGG